MMEKYLENIIEKHHIANESLVLCQECNREKNNQMKNNNAYVYE